MARSTFHRIRGSLAVAAIAAVMFSIMAGFFIGPAVALQPESSRQAADFTRAGAPRSSNGPGSSDQAGDEWPMFHGALNHTGVVMTVPAHDLGSSWNYTMGGDVESSPAVTSGRVYVGCDDYNVYCLNATTGARVWKYATGDWVESSPAVAGGRVYVGCDDYNVYCLNATTGKQIWNYSTGDWVESSPAVSDSQVYVGSDDYNVYCLNVTTGKQIWNYTTGYYVFSSPAVASGRVFVGSDDDDVYCLNATTGNQIWNYTTGDWVESSPVISGGRVYVGSDDHNVYCLNATTGKQIWNYTTGYYVFSSPAVASGRVFVGSDDDDVYCLNATTGNQIWNYTTGDRVKSSPAIVYGLVCVGSVDGNIYCLNATTGARVWNYSTGGYVNSSPAVAGGCMYVGSYNFKLYSILIYHVTPAPNPPSLSFWDKYGLIIMVSAFIVGIAIVVSVGVASRKAKHKKAKQQKSREKKILDVPLPAERDMNIEGKKALPAKTQKSEDGIAPKTEKDLAELQKTEQEVTAQLDVKLCIVHKGPIKGANYSCPQCNTFYCLGCATTLASNGEGCWSCGHKIELELDETLTSAGEKQFRSVENRNEVPSGDLSGIQPKETSSLPAETSVQPAIAVIAGRFQCPSCGKEYEYQASDASQPFECPDCKQPLLRIITCTHCGKPMSITQESFPTYIGKSIKCPDCNTLFKV